jgi:hypothetical protein
MLRLVLNWSLSAFAKTGSSAMNLGQGRCALYKTRMYHTVSHYVIALGVKETVDYGIFSLYWV